MSAVRCRAPRAAACIVLCAAMACQDEPPAQQFKLRPTASPVISHPAGSSPPPPAATTMMMPRVPPRVPPQAPGPAMPGTTPPAVPEVPTAPPRPLPPFMPVEPTEIAPPAEAPILERDLGTLEPGGPLPDCRAQREPGMPRARATRWLALRANRPSGPPRTMLIEVGEEGPGPVHDIAPATTDGVGEWSADGRFFATSGSPGSDGYVSPLADLESGAPVVSELAGRFGGFAPRGSRFLIFEPTPVLRNAEQSEAPATTLRVPVRESGFFAVARWSMDGRYLSLLEVVAGSDPQRLYVLDTEKDAPNADAAVSMGSVHGHAWAPDGHRLAFLIPAADDAALFVLDADRDGPPVEVARVQRESYDVTWIDPRRLLFQDPMGNPGIVDVSSDPPIRTIIDAHDTDAYPRLLGDNCVVYRGGCGPSALLGTCVAALDAGQTPEPRRVFPSDDDVLAMPTHGSPLVFNDPYDNRIIAIALEGGAFEPRRVSTPIYSVELAAPAVVVASGPDPSWVYYSSPVAAAHDRPVTARFWNGRTQRTYEFDPQTWWFDAGGAWASDGSLFATRVHDRTSATEGSELVLIRFGDERPVAQYGVGLHTVGVSSEEWLVWQP